jgi:hypothetical protein
MRVVAVIAALVVLLYFMLVTRRTVLRIFGWTVFFFVSGFIFINVSAQSRSPIEELTGIVNDLQALRSAALLFYVDFGTWPLPGHEASLDVYCKRPFAGNPRYAKMVLIDKSGDADGPPELYIGVELIPQESGAAYIQRHLASIAKKSRLLQQPVSGDIYKSGLSVYMRIDTSTKP